MTQMLAQREHDYFAETVICANCYIVAKVYAGEPKCVPLCALLDTSRTHARQHL